MHKTPRRLPRGLRSPRRSRVRSVRYRVSSASGQEVVAPAAMEGPEPAEGEHVLSLVRLGPEHLSLEQVPEERRREVQQLLLPHNRLLVLPPPVAGFSQLHLLDISNNNLAYIGDEILGLSKLRTLLAKNNRLDEASLPKELGTLRLEVVNFSGNQFEELPSQVLQMRSLKTLSLGGNRLKSIPAEIENVTSLEFLYLGGNFISYIPPELANLPNLSCLVLCDNRIQSVPPQLAQLHSLRSLSLHNNLLTYLPREILSLVRLQELSLRGNPLVVRFVRDLTYMPPTLLELAGRTVKSRGIPYCPWELPENLVKYLELASKCPNPKCGGVYFDSCVRHIKFVDFCGKYRLPLMHYLCSPECSSPCSSVSSQSESDSEDEASAAARRMQKVLLG